MTERGRGVATTLVLERTIGGGCGSGGAPGGGKYDADESLNCAIVCCICEGGAEGDGSGMPIPGPAGEAALESIIIPARGPGVNIGVEDSCIVGSGCSD